MLADLPPSSWATRFTVGAAACATSTPARVEPVNDIMSTSRMGRQGCAHAGAIAVDEVEHAFRHARLMHDLGEDDGVERRDLGGLQHHGAAGGDRGRDLAGDLVLRPVPRGDEAADADRLFADQVLAAALLELERAEVAGGLHEVAQARRAPGRRAASQPGAPISSEIAPAMSPRRFW